MDMGTAATCCVAIVTLGGLVLALLRFFRTKNDNPGSKNNGASYKYIQKQIDGVHAKFKEVMFKDACEPNIKRLEDINELTREALSAQISQLGIVFNNGLESVKLEIHNLKK